MTTEKRVLKLNRETIRKLREEETKAVVGGLTGTCLTRCHCNDSDPSVCPGTSPNPCVPG